VEVAGVGELRRTIVGSYLYGLRQVGGASEELLVEVVAPSADSLGKDEAGGRGAGEGERAYATVPVKEEYTQKSTRHGAVDS
jgi:hypothetical protein